MKTVSFDFDDTLTREVEDITGRELLAANPKYLRLLREHYEAGDKCIILTARSPHPKNHQEIIEFLARYKLDHCISDYVYTSHMPKGHFAWKNNVDLHYDDSDAHLDSVREYGIEVVDSKD